ncbi:MAG: hypothetical protein KA124_11840 [Luteimonas sp.]|nr:hypothetical protein [Luteimonas sp.]
MSVNPSHPYGPLPHQQPEPKPLVETLPSASPEAANDTIAGLDQDEMATFEADVQALPASERETLLNDLAGKLEADNLVKIHGAFGADAVAAAVDARAGSATRADYLALTGAEAKPVSDTGKLEQLRQDYADAKGEADKLNEELNTFLLRAGPLTDEQRAKFIESFKSADDRVDVYKAEADAAKALGDYAAENRDALLAASAKDPKVADQVVELLGDLADSGNGELALDMLGRIMAADPSSELAAAFASHADTLKGDLLERISSAAATEIIARNDGDLEAAVADLKEAYQPFKDAKGLYDGVSGGVDSFKEGMEMMEAVASGNFDPLKKLGDDFGEASPFARAMSAVGVVVGAVQAGQSGKEGEYLEAVQGFASAGEAGLNLLAGATKHLTDAGKFAQYGDDAAKFARFASRLAPGLGVIASATSAAINVQKAAEGQNVGYALAVVGDVFSMLGSAVALVPAAGTAAGTIVSGIGAVISAIGGYIGDAIDKHQTKEELRGYLEAAGLDKDTIELMLASGESQNRVASDLGISGEQWQQMLADDPMLAYAPYIFKEVADAYGLQGDQAVQMFDKLREDNPDALLELMKEFGEKPTAGIDYAPLVREFVASSFSGAHDYARSQETSTTRPDGTPKPAAELAADDYAGIRSGRLGEIVDKAEGLLEANDDHDYRVEVLKLLASEPFISLEVIYSLCGEYGVDPDEVT